MQLQNIKMILATIYVTAIGAATIALGVTSAAAWVGLGALAVLPTAAMMTLWVDPSKTMSESIQAARR